MLNTEISDLLNGVEIFKDLSENSLHELAERLKVENFSSGQVIIEKGEAGNSMFIIASGKVKVHDELHVIAVLEQGNFFGEFSLLDAAPRSMSVSALVDVGLISINRDMFYELLNSQPEVAKRIIGTLTLRLRNQNQEIIRQLKTREQELTRLVEERTVELQLRNEEITVKNREITDNLHYARRIQAAILPDVRVINETLKQSFVLYIPKDIVSGDFFSFFKQSNQIIVAAADCTGHGVSGAFLSVLGNSLLNQIINEMKISDPAKILDKLNEKVIDMLNQRQRDSNDGMDISICAINTENMQLRYAGANRPLWLIRRKELMAFGPDKFPVGGMQILHEHSFSEVLIQLEENDTLYIFTDGFSDQFGGERGKKLMTGKFKEILTGITELSMQEQQKFLTGYFENWKGNNEQVDDILVIGIRV